MAECVGYEPGTSLVHFLPPGQCGAVEETQKLTGRRLMQQKPGSRVYRVHYSL